MVISFSPITSRLQLAEDSMLKQALSSIPERDLRNVPGHPPIPLKRVWKKISAACDLHSANFFSKRPTFFSHAQINGNASLCSVAIQEGELTRYEKKHRKNNRPYPLCGNAYRMRQDPRIFSCKAKREQCHGRLQRSR